MGKIIDISGQRFGKLVAISFDGLDKHNTAVWNFVCDCGIIVQRTTKAIKKAKELYCGPQHPTKVCTKCKIEKDKSTDFHKCNSPMGISPMCKECKAIFYQENKIILKEKYRKKYHENPEAKENRRKISYASWQRNKHKELAYKRKYEKRPEVIERRKEIHRRRKQTDVQYNIKRRLRGRVRDTVKRVNGKGYKYKSSLVLLGCDMDFFKAYIESKFEEGMNWDRFAYIHIDHIKPCSQFDLTKYEDQKECFHYSNLQPLWEVDNLVKSWKYNA